MNFSMRSGYWKIPMPIYYLFLELFGLTLLELF
jgi:hypothetical protein